MTHYQIRAACSEDIESIINLCEQHAAFEGSTYDRTGKAARLSSFLFAEKPDVKCLVLQIGGELKGYASYSKEFSTWDAGYYMHMDCLYLQPEARKQGYGKKLMEAIIQEAAAEKCINVQWQTPINNTNAIAFYKAAGAMPLEKIRFFLTPKN